MPSRTRNYRGHVHKARSQILRIAVQFRFPFPLSARAKLPFCLFCLNSLHFDSGTTKRETEPASRRGFFLVSSRADLFSLLDLISIRSNSPVDLFRFPLLPLSRVHWPYNPKGISRRAEP